MKNYYSPFTFLGFVFIIGLSALGCQPDEPEPEVEAESILPYDSSKHIYATFALPDAGKQWEIVIDPNSGKFDKIPETESQFAGITFPIGTKELTDFRGKNRLFIPIEDDSKLIVESLEDFTSVDIKLTDTALNKTIVFPQLMKFGKDENEVFIIDSDKSLWKVDLNDEFVLKIHDKIPVSSDTYIANFFYIESTDKFVICTNNNAVNDARGDNLQFFDPKKPDSLALTGSTSIPFGLGFVRHPIFRNTINYLNVSVDGTEPEKLMKVMVGSESFNISDVLIPELTFKRMSTTLQTINSSLNSYITLGSGGSNNTGPINTLYSIDLDSGEVIGEVELEEAGTILKLAGE